MEKFIIIALYIVAMAVIGLWSRKRTQDFSAFLLGNRQVGAWMSAFAYGTTYFSAVVFIGYAGRNGWGFGLWAVLVGVGNAVIGSYLAWKLLARRTRDMTHRLKLSTMPEFFQARYDSKGMKTFAALIIFIFMTPYSASVYSGLSYLFEKIFGIPFVWAIILMAAISAVYLVIGGYVATVMADLVQGVIMLGGIIWVIAIALGNSSIGGVVTGVKSMIDQAGTIPLTDFSQPSNLLGLLSLILLTSLGPWGLPQMIHKFYAIKDDKAIKAGTTISLLFAIVISCGAYFLGAVAKLFYTRNSDLLPMADGKIVFDQIIPNFLSSTMPDLVLGIVVVLILSASVTTLTGIVLVSSSSLVIDLIKPVKKGMTSAQSLTLTRVFCLVFIVISVAIALTKSPIQTLMSFSWGTVAGCFLAPYMLGLYWKGVTRAGVWAGMLGGLVSSVVLALVSKFDASQAPLFGVVAMAVSLLLTITVSLFTPKYGTAHIEHVFEGTVEEGAQ